MYSDQVESGTRRSAKERLDRSFSTDSTRQHRITGKRGALRNETVGKYLSGVGAYDDVIFLPLAATENSILVACTIQSLGSYYLAVESLGSYDPAVSNIAQNTLGNLIQENKLVGAMQRQDDKWKHDLYEDDEPQISNRKVTAQDLRLKLQKKGLHPGGQTGKSSAPGERDLRERLSGTMTPQPKNYDPPKPKVALKPISKSIDAETPSVLIKKSANPAPKKSRKADAPLDDFLLSLGLEKYLIGFQAEEVDMTALKHMTDADLKAMGIPMGPRKKILLALESKG
ncbi:hypothetical protein Fmac_011257 [Flemingia macrophylla]|uniref:SAM domain-containing protein n=1 Tax=Flemingia macrophylla TaxID=520843 RepID=A0ABD1MM86_9FABA